MREALACRGVRYRVESCANIDFKWAVRRRHAVDAPSDASRGSISTIPAGRKASGALLGASRAR
jgi:hypothetical protein